MMIYIRYLKVANLVVISIQKQCDFTIE